jgi:hypothetical protein
MSTSSPEGAGFPDSHLQPPLQPYPAGDIAAGHASPAEVDRARDHLTSVKAYAPFDLLPDGRLMSGCMDPRADAGESPYRRQLTKIMGPGGEVGEAADHATALTVVRGELVTIEDAIVEDMTLRRASVHGAHRRCAYVDSIAGITGEQANPSDATLSSYERWVAEHELEQVLTATILQDVIDAAGVLQAYLSNLDNVHHLVDAVEAAHPDYDNVPDMQGDATPAFYIVNKVPHLGLNRHRMHTKEQLKAQAYHDNLTARLDEVHNTHRLPHATRLLRMSALLLRSAATFTVIDGVKRAAGRPVERWEIEIGLHGPEFRQISA